MLLVESLKHHGVGSPVLSAVPETEDVGQFRADTFRVFLAQEELRKLLVALPVSHDVLGTSRDDPVKDG